jgi:hypothetical protein
MILSESKLSYTLLQHQIMELFAQTSNIIVVMAIIKAVIIDGGTISLKFIMAVDRILPTSLVGMAADSPYQQMRPVMNEDDEGKDDQNQKENVRMQTDAVHSKGFITVTRRYKFTFEDVTTKSTRCFHKIPFESLGTGVYFDSKGATYYRLSYIKHMNSIRSSSTTGRDLMVDNVMKELSSRAVTYLNDGYPYNAADNVLQVLALCTTTRTSSTYSIKQWSSLLSGICGSIGSILGAISSLKSALQVLRGAFARQAFDIALCNEFIKIAKLRESTSSIVFNNKKTNSGDNRSVSSSKRVLKTSEEREMNKVATYMLYLYEAIGECKGKY